MKKTYINPELQIVELEIKQFVMTSTRTSGLDGVTNEEYDPDNTIDW